MSLRRLASKVMKVATPVAKMTPVGRVASIGASLASTAKRVISTGFTSMTPTGSILQAVQKAVGPRKRRKNFKGVSSREMLELMKLQMLIGKRSLPYQMAVMKAVFGKLK